jgi:hypothetical protein
MRLAARLLKLEARTQHIADELDGSAYDHCRPFHVQLAKIMDGLREILMSRECSPEEREMAQEQLAKLQAIHGDWTVEQGWRHYFAGGEQWGQCEERLDHLEPLPHWQEMPFFPYYKFDFPQKSSQARNRRRDEK